MKGNDFEVLEQIIDNFENKKTNLIPILQETQSKFNYLSKESIQYISKKISIPVSQIYGVATFYTQFRLNPVGKNIIRICHGTACHVAGAKKISETICDELNVKPGDTTENLKFTVEEVACLGCCSLAPVIMIDDKIYGRLTPQKVKGIIEDY